MNTKLLMTLSAIVMALIGLTLQFFPHESLNYMGASSEGAAPVLMQITGALYLGFAMTNWMAKAVLIGGIYARPLAIGNLAHFTVGALALIKYAFSAGSAPVIWAAAIIYAIFAVLFGIVFTTHPKQVKS
jgi:hypothetical protein